MFPQKINLLRRERVYFGKKLDLSEVHILIKIQRKPIKQKSCFRLFSNLILDAGKHYKSS